MDVHHIGTDKLEEFAATAPFVQDAYLINLTQVKGKFSFSIRELADSLEVEFCGTTLAVKKKDAIDYLQKSLFVRNN